MDIVKIKEYTVPNLTKLLFYESKDDGKHYMFNGQLNCDPEIAAAILDAMHRGRGRWELIIEKDA